jgi:hypothetical protein
MSLFNRNVIPSRRPRGRARFAPPGGRRVSHPWTNGFVERLQGTILQEHWRVQFRRRYFTSRPALARSLAEFLRFYNDQRPHQGYRLRGQTPSALFHGAAAVPH